jgi:hypothetical protein
MSARIAARIEHRPARALRCATCIAGAFGVAVGGDHLDAETLRLDGHLLAEFAGAQQGRQRL